MCDFRGCRQKKECRCMIFVDGEVWARYCPKHSDDVRLFFADGNRHCNQRRESALETF